MLAREAPQQHGRGQTRREIASALGSGSSCAHRAGLGPGGRQEEGGGTIKAGSKALHIHAQAPASKLAWPLLTRIKERTMARVAKAVGSVKVRGGQVVSCGWLLPACLPPTPVPHLGGYCPPACLPHPSLMWVAIACLPASHTHPSCGWPLPACLPPTPVPLPPKREPHMKVGSVSHHATPCKRPSHQTTHLGM